MMVSSYQSKHSTDVDPHMTLEHTDKGLPIWTEDTVAEHYQQIIKKYKGRKPWLDCQSCEAQLSSTKLYHCSGCIKNGVWDRARYCGRICQKKDWINHRWMCKYASDSYNELRYDEEDRKIFCGSARQFRRRNNALKGIEHPIDWATRQAFLHCEITDPVKAQFTFHMAALRGRHPASVESITVPELFTFSPFEWPVQWGPRKVRPLGPYAFDGDSGERTTGWAYLDDAEGDILSPLLPQWPYVFAQCCITDHFHPEIMRIRLEILVDTIRKFPDPEGLLDAFIPPKFKSRWEIPDAQFNEWMELMGPVIGSISMV